MPTRPRCTPTGPHWGWTPGWAGRPGTCWSSSISTLRYWAALAREHLSHAPDQALPHATAHSAGLRLPFLTGTRLAPRLAPELEDDPLADRIELACGPVDEATARRAITAIYGMADALCGRLRAAAECVEKQRWPTLDAE
ncbi:hypothetical protein [Streptomyces sp. NBC_00151]|uniref:hypothetical protein n=1 Tax=Streptomyces sp. NBC_00151 TaxID=2975669 RepID=UPI002DDAAF7B|nr:hypothetical protein [Streptomyces sp. NBC_00151]WRZ36783.1 hypothetical protein OG915_01050 [Streptomyces sp. NBC_00151]WRZ44794.1 hypothetical protein OG915_46510 [Streptomyces sp. NBC_00151]